LGNKDTSFNTKTRPLNCNGKLIDFEIPKVMGILNLTPDSFYDGGRYSGIDKYLLRTEQMITEGAAVVDIGAFSSRPGAKLISMKKEAVRLIPVLKDLIKHFPQTIFSVDTYRSEIAKQCFETGAGIINDISGGNYDKEMFSTIAKLNIPYILMHLHGLPEDMQQNPIRKNASQEIKLFFQEKVDVLNKLGFDKTILDPGYGFGKSLDCNYEILKNQNNLKINNLPIMAGLSRKSVVNKVLNTKPKDALNGTTILNLMALQNGANILRVHDVKEAVETVKLFKYYENIDSCD